MLLRNDLRIKKKMSYNNQPDWEEMPLPPPPTSQALPKELKDWLIQNFKDCEEGKLTEDQKTKFLDFIDDNKQSKYVLDAFKEFRINKGK